MLKITSKKVTALIAVVLMITTLVITAIAAPVHTHEDISPNGVGNCCSNPCIEDYRVIHTKYSTHCVTTIRKYCWECGASEDSQATSVGGCTWWCTMTHWNDRRDPRT